MKRVYRNLLKIQFVPSQAFPVSRFMKRIAESMQDYNNAEFLLSILSEMRKFYKTTPLPQTREEFEARAVLYQIAADLEALVLVKQSFDVLEAGDGEEALDIFYGTKDIALIILDVMMPKMDGWEVLKTIRKYSQVPVVMLTARSEERDELQGFSLG